jgi:hypothetical protein
LIRSLRALIVVAALAAVLTVSIASSGPAHFHTGSAANRCDLCFTAHTTVYDAPVVQALPLPEIQGRAILLLPSSNYQPLSRQSSRSRGPPVFAL